MKIKYKELVPTREMLGKVPKCLKCQEPTHEDYVYKGVCFSCLYKEAEPEAYTSITEKKKK